MGLVWTGDVKFCLRYIFPILRILVDTVVGERIVADNHIEAWSP